MSPEDWRGLAQIVPMMFSQSEGPQCPRRHSNWMTFEQGEISLGAGRLTTPTPKCDDNPKSTSPVTRRAIMLMSFYRITSQ